MKRNTPKPTPTPDKAGSRAASTAHFNKLIAGWRKRRGLTSAAVAAILCCTERTVRSWEAGRSKPTGFNLKAIAAAIEGGSI